jgi:hypothetical protein
LEGLWTWTVISSSFKEMSSVVSLVTHCLSLEKFCHFGVRPSASILFYICSLFSYYLLRVLYELIFSSSNIPIRYLMFLIPSFLFTVVSVCDVKFSLSDLWPLVICSHVRVSHSKAGTQRNICTPKFITAFFTIANTWKQARCSLMGEWMNTEWPIHATEYYPASKRKGILRHASVDKPRGNTEGSKSVTKDKYCVIPSS